MEQSDELRVSSFPKEFLSMAEYMEEEETGEQKEILNLEDLEREHIKKVLKITGGNRTQAAKYLGLSRATLITKLKKYKFEEENR